MVDILNFFKPPSYSVLRSFALKMGVAAAAVYYINEQGVWRQSNESIKAYQTLKEVSQPYLQEVSSQIPYELPTLPEHNVLSSVIKESWNKSILITFKFLSDLPDTTRELTTKGFDTVKKNEEIKKLLDSFS